MKRQLDDKISGLKDDFDLLEKYKATAVQLMNQYNSVLQMKKQMEVSIAEFQNGQAKVNDIGQKYDQLMAIAGTIDEKIKSLNTTSDDLLNIEVKVRDFKESLSTVSARYDRLEQKEEVINRVCKDVDASFDNLKALEDRLKVCTRAAETLPAEIKDVQRNVDELLKHGPKITDAASKLDNLSAVLDDIQKRMDDINSSRNGIAKSEQRLQELNVSIDKKFKDLAFVSKQDAEKNPPEKGAVITPQERDIIKKLKVQGWQITEIAKRMNRSEYEISLILQIPD